ncbi:MAG: hypothetical protein AMXMBFR13_10240 [Phycisphaerae bacterium]
MAGLAKWMVVAGAALMFFGVVLWALSRLGFRGLPGDVRYESENVRFYFPVVTCLVLSVVATLALWLWQWLGRR